MRLAAEADGMSLGTCVLVLPLYEPLHVAEQVSPPKSRGSPSRPMTVGLARCGRRLNGAAVTHAAADLAQPFLRNGSHPS
jgi:hypothetical protein